MITKFKRLALTMLLFAITTGAFTQSQYKVYSGFMFHFATNTKWPSNKASGDFVMGVYGSSPIQKELVALSKSKKIGARNIVVKNITSTSALSSCHIVFVPKNQMSKLSSITSAAKSSNVMVVTESPGGAKSGSTFNFVTSNSKIRFELNKVSASTSGLVISTNIQKLALTPGNVGWIWSEEFMIASN